ncbi:fluoride efflux transporter FluC [Nocardioides speluncae]|uniref:fluoride efflux transporter FluC n=1 Tax=Nocardioides speluncae TaxID=2670337 RepID=UPI000D696866|nr:CrcB family protein [Nocardioides speluncae]
MTPLLVAVGAAAGAVLRYLAGHYLDGTWHRGTLLVNVAGSFLLGVFSGWALSGAWLALLGTGFCGGLTTYSAFAVQATEHGPRRGTAYALVTVAAGLAAAYLGFVLGRAL